MTEDHPLSWLARAVARHPERTALTGRDFAWSFAALDAESDRLAARLARTFPQERLLAARMSAPRDVWLLALAAFKAGKALFPINPAFDPGALESRLALVGHPPLLESLPPPAPPVPGRALEGVDIHVVVSTSGSTGAPKGVMLTGANLGAAVTASRAGLALSPGDCWLGCLGLWTIGGLSVPLRCLEAGATCHVIDHFEVETVAARLSAGIVTHVSLVPAMLAALLDEGVSPPPGLRAVLIGGAALSAPLAERAWAAGWPILPSYGMSETGSQAATHAGGPRSWRPGLAGHPLPGLSLGLTEDGRIRLKGPQVMAGYANPDLEKGRGLSPGGWFETSDLGRIEEDGSLVVLGRADDVLVSGGHKIHPLEVEHLLARCPGIGAAAVSAAADPVWGDMLAVLFTGPVTPDALLSWCREHLPSHLRPRRAARVAALPLLASGKLDRRALRAIAASPGG